MNEIDKKLIEIQAQINACVTMEESFKKRIGELKAQLAEAEKPKLRHGDFGISDSGGARVILCYDFDKLITAGDGSVYPHEYEGYNPNPVLGNIFDLMKDWGKDFKGFTVLGQCNFVGWISIKNPDRIHLKIVGGESTYTEVELYEIWCNLGHALIELKRKKQGD